MSDARRIPDAPLHYNRDLERQVLGQVLMFGGVWDLFLGAGLQETDFFAAANRLVFRAIATVVTAGVKPDLVTVGLELRRSGFLEEVGAAYFAGLVDGTVRPLPESAAFIAGELADLAAKRAVSCALERGDLEEIAAQLDARQNRGGDQRRIYDAAGQLSAVPRTSGRRRRVAWRAYARIWSDLRGARSTASVARDAVAMTLRTYFPDSRGVPSVAEVSASRAASGRVSGLSSTRAPRTTNAVQPSAATASRCPSSVSTTLSCGRWEARSSGLPW
jgi:hypothetical protein